jgi:hypothetical protein
VAINHWSWFFGKREQFSADQTGRERAVSKALPIIPLRIQNFDPFEASWLAPNSASGVRDNVKAKNTILGVQATIIPSKNNCRALITGAPIQRDFVP